MLVRATRGATAPTGAVDGDDPVDAVPPTRRRCPMSRKVDRLFRRSCCRAAGIEHPTEDDHTAVRLLMQLWFGVIQSCLNGRISIPDAEVGHPQSRVTCCWPMSNAQVHGS